MWVCEKCGEQMEDQFDSCWKCAPGELSGQVVPPEAAPASLSVKFETFSPGFLTNQAELFGRVAAFATALGPDRIISLTQASGDLSGAVTVWYWDGVKRRDGSPPATDEPPRQQEKTN